MKIIWLGALAFFTLLGLAGMALATFRLNVFRPIFRKHTTRRTVTTVFAVIYLLASIGLLSVARFVPNKKPTKNEVISPLIPSLSQSQTQKETNSPKDGALQYEYIDSIINPSGSIRFIYSTNERREERLIDLNKFILSDLTKKGKISKSTIYNVSYFDSPVVAKTYFSKITDQNTSADQKQILKNSYVAEMTHNPKFKIDTLLRIGDAKVLK